MDWIFWVLLAVPGLLFFWMAYIAWKTQGQ